MKIFISHVTEDKNQVARSLASALIKEGYSVWHDEFSLKAGDDVRRSIEKGLARCDYGVVILSKNFLSKEWPQKELEGVFLREAAGKKVLLPIWHGIAGAEIRTRAPMFADKLAISTERGLAAVLEAIKTATTTTCAGAPSPGAFRTLAAHLKSGADGVSKAPVLFPNVKGAVKEAIEYIEQQQSRPNQRSQQISTGLGDLDAITGGLQAGKLYVIGGGQGSGKTSLAVTIARNVTMAQKKALVLSSDLSSTDFALKLILGAAKISLDTIRAGMLAEKMFPPLTRAAGQIAVSKLAIADRRTLLISELERECDSLKEKPDCLVIDDESALEIDAAELSAALLAGSETAWCCRRVRQICRRFQIPGVLTLSAQPRAESAGTLKPGMRHSLLPTRRDCDFLALLEPQESEPDAAPGESAKSLLIKILINNEGRLGEIPGVIIGSQARVENMAPFTVADAGQQSSKRTDKRL